jgi:hypothetical protein
VNESSQLMATIADEAIGAFDEYSQAMEALSASGR